MEAFRFVSNFYIDREFNLRMAKSSLTQEEKPDLLLALIPKVFVLGELTQNFNKSLAFFSKSVSFFPYFLPVPLFSQ